jgi:hypothetical protein
MPSLWVSISPEYGSLSAPDAFLKDLASLTGKRDWSDTMLNLIDIVLAMIPTSLALTFMLWVLWNFWKASGKRSSSVRRAVTESRFAHIDSNTRQQQPSTRLGRA